MGKRRKRQKAINVNGDKVPTTGKELVLNYKGRKIYIRVYKSILAPHTSEYSLPARVWIGKAPKKKIKAKKRTRRR